MVSWAVEELVEVQGGYTEGAVLRMDSNDRCTSFVSSRS